MSTPKTTELWQSHTVDEILDIYKDWAAKYEDDVGEWGYATPGRLAMALRKAGASPAKPVLDFGCGTGLSGLALKSVGFDIVDGVDVSAEMLEKAEQKGVYRQVWQGQPGSMGHIARGDYATIAACGVVSMGAAPPETLKLLAGAVGPAGLLGFSYNDATLEDAGYMGALAEVLAGDDFTLLSEEYGAHLPNKGMKSTVYVIQRN